MVLSTTSLVYVIQRNTALPEPQAGFHAEVFVISILDKLGLSTNTATYRAE